MLTNRSHNEANGVTVQYHCKQDTDPYNPVTWLGSCYGYSLAQAVDENRYLRIPENALGRSFLLPLTDIVLNVQATQIFPILSDRKQALHLFYSGLHDLIDELDNQGEDNSKLIIGCVGLIGGHAVGLQKNSDGTFVFFDCNKAKHIINSKEQLKAWLPVYFDLNYGGYFYGFNAEYVKTEPQPILPNFVSTCSLFLKRFLYIPLGFYGVGRFIANAISPPKAIENNVNNNPPQYGSTANVKMNFNQEPDVLLQDAELQINSQFEGFIPTRNSQSVPRKEKEQNYLHTAARMGAIGRH
jgi:hypothetical protein